MKKTIMWKEINEQKTAIPNCISKNKEILKQISKNFNEKKPTSIIIAARGTSDHVAHFAKYLFETHCGIPVSLAAPSITTLYQAKINFSNSLVIGISQSGSAQDVLEVLQSAKSQGAITIGITNTEDSVVAKESQYHLFCNAGKENSVAATKTFLTQLYLATALVKEISGSKQLDIAINNLDNTIETALSLCQSAIEASQTFRFSNEIFVLARGFGYPISMECALKIQETTYTRARCYSVSDFHHGPFAMVSSEIPIILLSLDKRVEKDSLEMIEKLKNENAFILSITTSKKVSDLSDKSILLPEDMDEISACFASAIIGQTFACSLAILKSNNPDSPRGLKKVTITR